MAIHRNEVDESKFNRKAVLPGQPSLKDLGMTVEDVYLSDWYFVGKKLIDSGKII